MSLVEDYNLSNDETLGSVKFIGILLLMAGVESNPGPKVRPKVKHDLSPS